MATYCTPDDLIVGDIGEDDLEDREKFAQVATEEMNEVLGQVYVLPLTPKPPATTLAVHVVSALTRACRFIASGRYLMDASAAGQSDGVNAYGEYLLREGQGLLMSMATRTFDLGAIPVATGESGDSPVIRNYDATSGVDAFYAFVSGDPYAQSTSVGWRPGPA